MKALAAIALALILVGGWRFMEQRAERKAIIAEAEKLAVANAEVTLFSTSWCGYCDATRRFLVKREIPFVEFDIEKSRDGERRYRALGGTGGVPLLEVKGKVIRGYDEAGILAALR